MSVISEFISDISTAVGTNTWSVSYTSETATVSDIIIYVTPEKTQETDTDAVIATFVYEGGYICVNISGLDTEIINGDVLVDVTFSQDLNTLDYATKDVYKLSSDGAGKKTIGSESGNVITFTDNDCSTHQMYRFGFYDESGNRLGQSLWDNGLYVTKIAFCTSENTYTYTVTKR